MGVGGQGKSDMLTRRWERGDNCVGEFHLYACLLVNQKIYYLQCSGGQEVFQILL